MFDIASVAYQYGTTGVITVTQVPSLPMPLPPVPAFAGLKRECSTIADLAQDPCAGLVVDDGDDGGKKGRDGKKGGFSMTDKYDFPHECPTAGKKGLSFSM